jgi:hypothetical protein
MRIVIVILSIFIVLKTFSYGIYEIKNNENKSGGIAVICVSLLSAILCDVIVYLR